jgi:hypothetical protein
MLSRTVALPVIVGAALLKGIRLRSRGVPAGERAAFVAGTATSFASTLGSQALIRLVERDSALWPYAAYRSGLAATVLAKVWLGRRGRAKRAAELGRLATAMEPGGDGRGPDAVIPPEPRRVR